MCSIRTCVPAQSRKERERRFPARCRSSRVRPVWRGPTPPRPPWRSRNGRRRKGYLCKLHFRALERQPHGALDAVRITSGPESFVTQACLLLANFCLHLPVRHDALNLTQLVATRTSCLQLEIKYTSRLLSDAYGKTVTQFDS